MKVALAGVKGDLTMVRLVKKYDIHADQISNCQKQPLGSAADMFGKGAQQVQESAETT